LATVAALHFTDRRKDVCFENSSTRTHAIREVWAQVIHAEVDPRRCCGYRLCLDVAPGVFAINSAGKAESVVSDIPADQEQAARVAAQECPSAAITIRAAGPQQ
jgi:ferredoxin